MPIFVALYIKHTLQKNIIHILYKNAVLLESDFKK